MQEGEESYHRGAVGGGVIPERCRRGRSHTIEVQEGEESYHRGAGGGVAIQVQRGAHTVPGD